MKSIQNAADKRRQRNEQSMKAAEEPAADAKK
jgi:hypothetical protein